MYAFCLLVWGLNFIAVKIQGTPVSLEVSLCYRLIGAAAMFLIFAALTRPAGRPSRADAGALVTFGVCNFALSYLLLYYATTYVSAALVTLLFSLKTVLTPVALRTFLGEPLRARILWGGLIGIIGVLVLAWPMLTNGARTNDIYGFLLGLFGTLLAALGDVSSARNARRGVDPVYANAAGFAIAALLLLTVCAVQRQRFQFPTSTNYLAALVYLTVIASFAAWMFYLKLVEQIGAAASGYMVAAFPAVGGVASLAIGESQPTVHLFAGCLLCCAGAATALGARRPARALLIRHDEV